MSLKSSHVGALVLAVIGAAIAPAASAQEAPTIAVPALDSAQARQRDAESLASLSAEGRLLYGRDKVKLAGFQYCGQAVSLAERGEFRQSIRAASKSLCLGQRSKDAAPLGSSYRDLAIVYSYAGELSRAEEHARQALQQPGSDPKLIAAPANKVLGDVALRQGDTQRRR